MHLSIDLWFLLGENYGDRTGKCPQIGQINIWMFKSNMLNINVIIVSA